MSPSKELSEDTSYDPLSQPSFSPYSITTTLFQIPKAYPTQKHYTKHKSLPYCYFKPLIHILLDIKPSYNIPLTSLELPIEAKGSPTGSIPTVVLSYHPVTLPGLTASKTPTKKTSTILPTQLYTYIYFIHYSIPHMPYIILCFPITIMTHEHPPNHSPHT